MTFREVQCWWVNIEPFSRTNRTVVPEIKTTINEAEWQYQGKHKMGKGGGLNHHLQVELEDID